MKNKFLYCILMLMMIFSLTACAENEETTKNNQKDNFGTTNMSEYNMQEESSTSEQETTENTTTEDTDVQDTTESTTTGDTDIQDTTESTTTEDNEKRKMTCYTQRGKDNPNYPDFAFDYYVDLWYYKNRKEDMIYNECITYMNEEQDVTLKYMDYVNPNGLGGDGKMMTIIEVSKVADSQLVLDGEKFVVAKIKTVASMFMETDTEYTPVDGDVCYAVVPESLIGTHEGVRGLAGLYTKLSFEYGGRFTIIAEVAGREFTPEEEEIIIEVLSTFRMVEDGN